MSRLFVNASNQYLEYAGAVLTAPPLTFAAWYRPASLTNAHLVSLSNGGGTGWFSLQAGATGTVSIQEYDGSISGSAATAIALSPGVWAHVGAVVATHSDRTAYVNGTGTNNASSTAAATGLSKTNVGAVYIAGALNTGFQANGDLAEVAIWNVGLTALEMAILAAGVSPRRVRPLNLVAYWPIKGYASPEIDLIGHKDLTVTGATASAHPRILQAWAPTLVTKGGVIIPATTGNMLLVF